MIPWFIRNWLVTLAFTIALGVAGLWAWTKVPVDALLSQAAPRR